MIRGNHRSAIGYDQIAEQPQLCVEIMRHVRVIIHVVAREIGERAGADTDALEPILIEAMRRSLQREMRDALTCDFVELPMQRDRVGRGQRAIDGALRRYQSDGADASGYMPEP